MFLSTIRAKRSSKMTLTTRAKARAQHPTRSSPSPPTTREGTNAHLHRGADLSRQHVHQHGQGLLLVLLVVELGRLLLDVVRRLVYLRRRLGLPLGTARSAVATCVGHRQSCQLWRPLQSGQLWRPLIMFRGLLLGCILISSQRQQCHIHHQVAVHV